MLRAKFSVALVVAVSVVLSQTIDHSTTSAAGDPIVAELFFGDIPGQSFSPNGDEQEDTTSGAFCISRSANVDVAVSTSAGLIVATLETGVSRAGNIFGSCNFGQNFWNWDGRDDAGTILPDGTYTIAIHATDADGNTADLTTQRTIDTRIPGQLTQPTPGSLLSGTVTARFQPAAGFDLTSAHVSCLGSMSEQLDGSWSVTGSTEQCSHGTQQWSSSVSWVDDAGSGHTWSPPPVDVIVENPLAAALFVSDIPGQSFSPNGDEQEDTTGGAYCLSNNALVDVTITDIAGNHVRTIETGTQHNGNIFGSCNFGQNFWNWDGRDDAGTILPDGTYTIAIHATDADGNTADLTTQRTIDTRIPGQLTQPTPGSLLSGTVTARFQPAAGFDLTSAHVSCLGSMSEQLDGSWSVTGSTEQCSHGTQQWSSSVSWVDDAGSGHTWSPPPVDVIVENPLAAALFVSDIPGQSFSPNGDEQEDTTGGAYCLSNNALVDVTITDIAGNHVRTIETGTQHNGNIFGSCNFGQNFWNWDGRDDAGTILPDGTYTIAIHATDADGNTADLTTQRTIDTRIPGQLTQPTPGSLLSGTVTARFQPAAGFDLTSAHVSCLGSMSEQLDGSWSVTGSTEQCSHGTQQWSSSVSWVDDAGSGHTWSPPPVDVIVENPLAAALFVSDIPGQSFSPNGDEQEDTTGGAYCLSNNALVDVTITDIAGNHVRTIETGTQHNGNIFGSCNFGQNFWNWDGRDDAGTILPDGTYTIAIHATDADGNTADLTTQRTIDTRIPGQLTQPTPGSTVAGLARLVFTPSSGFDTVTQVSWLFSTGGHATAFGSGADGSWRTTIRAGTLNHGPAFVTASVTFTDAAGVHHNWTSPQVPVTIDTTAVPLAVTLHPSAGVAPLSTTLRLESSDPNGLPLTYQIHFGDGTPSITGQLTAPYAPIEVPHVYVNPGSFNASVSVSNGQGGAAISTANAQVSTGVNHPPTAVLALSEITGVVPVQTTATISGSDPDLDSLTYELAWGDGSTPSTGSLPIGFSPSHVYSRSGTYVARLAVSDGRLTTVTSATVIVGLAEPLKAVIGDPLVVMTGATVAFDGSASRPAFGIESFSWDFGDGDDATGAIVSHVFDTPGSYEVELTVRAAGSSASATTDVEVRNPTPGTGLTVSVIDTGGSPIGGADVLVIAPSGQRFGGTTGPDGMATIDGLADGSYTVYGWRPGFIPAVAEAALIDGRGTSHMVMSPGQVAVASVESRPLTIEEVVAAGIDPDDPSNQHVYEFTAEIAVNTAPLSEITGYTSTGGLIGVAVNNTPCVDYCQVNDYRVYPRVTYAGDHPNIVWLVIPGVAKSLKEFFDVQVTVTNLAPPAFSLNAAAATLELPAGLSLAPTATPQPVSRTMPPIAGGSSGSANWVVRGDVEGFYNISASIAATLEPIGAPISLTARTLEPLHVWGASALEMRITMPSRASAGHPFGVTFALENVADVPVYNVGVELLTAGKENYIYQPRQRLDFGTGKLDPGATFESGEFILVPSVTGTVDLGQSLVSFTAGSSGPPVSITTRDPIEPLTVRSHPIGQNQIRLDWQAIPGATRYEIFATPDASTDFGRSPAFVAPANATTAFVSGVGISDQLLAVSTVIDGRNVMVHALADEPRNAAPMFVSPTPGYRSKFDLQVGDSTSFSIVAADPDVDPFTLEYSTSGFLVGDPDELNGLDCTTSEGRIDCAYEALEDGLRWFTVHAEDINGASSEFRTFLVGASSYKYVALGDSFSAGEGVDPYFRDRSGFEKLDNRCHRSTNSYAEHIQIGGPWSLYERAAREGGATPPGTLGGLNKYGSDLNHREGDGIEWVFWACSGAEMVHLSDKAQESPGEFYDTFPQLDGGHIDHTTDLVTLSISGNDLGFSELINQCARSACTSGNDPVLSVPALTGRINSKENELVTTLRAVKTETYNARVLLVGYPYLFPASGFEQSCATLIPFSEEMATFRELQDVHTEMMKRAARRAGAEFVDVRAQFAQHEICGLQGAWLNPVHLSLRDGVNHESFHPTLTGQRSGYAAAINSYLSGNPTPPPERSIVQQGASVITSIINRVPGVGIFRTAWPGSDVEMSLVSPTGRTIDRSTVADDVAHVVGPTYEAYAITNAELGEWTVTMYGADVAPQGEPVQLEFVNLDANGQPVVETLAIAPVAQVDRNVIVGDGPLTVELDGGNSHDPDGHIVSHTWDFGGGDTVDSVAVTRTFPIGTHVAKLVVTDNSGQTNWDKVLITVNDPNDPPANQPPVARADVATVVESGEVLIDVLANDNDPESGEIVLFDATAPGRGYATITQDNQIRYEPFPGACGDDNFEYTIADNAGLSASASVSVRIECLDGVPSAVPDQYTTNEDTALTVVAPGVLGNDTDPGGSVLIAELVTGVEHGALTLSPDGAFTYTPDDNFNGSDSFTYRASDGTLASSPVTVKLTVTPVDDSPVSASDNYLTDEDTSLSVATAGVLTNDSDADDQTLLAVLEVDVTEGELDLNDDGSFTYVPEANFYGTDRFVYHATDGTTSSTPTTVTIIVHPVNDPTIGSDDIYTIEQDTDLVVPEPGVLANDTDIDSSSLEARLIGGASHGTVTLGADGSFVYIPADEFSGTDTFTYRASDGSTTSEPVTVTVTVTPKVEPIDPTAVDDSYSVAEDESLAQVTPGVLDNDTDPDSPILTAQLVTTTTHGTLTLDPSGSFIFVPNTNYAGSDSFTYHASDGQLTSAVATVAILVTPVDDPPVATANTYTTDEDTAITVAAPGVLSDDSDVDSTSLTVVPGVATTNGTVSLSGDGSFTYTPATNFNGSDSFTYSVSDGNSTSDEVTVTITVTPANDAPTATPDAYVTTEGRTLTVDAPGVLSNDTDVDSTTLTAATTSDPTNGTVVLESDGSFTYAPAAGFAGEDSFSYVAFDGELASVPRAVTLTVLAVPDTTIDSGPAAVTKQRDATIGFSARPATATFACSLDGTAFSPCTSPLTLVTLAEGSHSLLVKAISSSGVVDPTPAAINWVVDTTSPSIAVTTPVQNAVFRVGQAVTPAASCSDTRDPNPLLVVGAINTTTATATPRTFVATCTDSVGNTHTESRSYTVQPAILNTRQVRWSTSVLRTGSRTVDDATLSGLVTIFVTDSSGKLITSSSGIRSVRFKLISASGVVALNSLETSAPYDAGGTNLTRSGLIDTGKWKNGTYRLETTITPTTGADAVLTSNVTVANAHGPNELRWSNSTSRTPSAPLQNATLRGRVAIFLDTNPFVVERVTFFVDQSNRAFAVEYLPGYDFGTTTGRPPGRATLVDVAKVLRKGNHTIRAVIDYRDGASATVTSSFTVT